MSTALLPCQEMRSREFGGSVKCSGVQNGAQDHPGVGITYIIPIYQSVLNKYYFSHKFDHFQTCAPAATAPLVRPVHRADGSAVPSYGEWREPTMTSESMRGNTCLVSIGSNSLAGMPKLLAMVANRVSSSSLS